MHHLLHWPFGRLKHCHDLGREKGLTMSFQPLVAILATTVTHMGVSQRFLEIQVRMIKNITAPSFIPQTLSSVTFSSHRIARSEVTPACESWRWDGPPERCRKQKNVLKEGSTPGRKWGYWIIGLLRGGVPRGGGSLIFPKVPQSSLGILRVPQLPPPWTNPP